MKRASAAGEGSPPWLLALDTNVLVYAEGQGDPERCTRARELLADLPGSAVVLPVQVLGELHHVLTAKFKRPAASVAQALMSWADAFAVADTTWPALQSALDLASAHGLPTWDALVLAVAAEHRCRVLLSEDFQAGFAWRGVTVVNPFVHPLPALLQDLLA